jgi:hypothetical protein
MRDEPKIDSRDGLTYSAHRRNCSRRVSGAHRAAQDIESVDDEVADLNTLKAR